LTDFSNEDRPIIASLNSSVRFVSGGLGAALGGLLFQISFRFSFLLLGISLLVLSVYSSCFIKVAKDEI